MKIRVRPWWGSYACVGARTHTHTHTQTNTYTDVTSPPRADANFLTHFTAKGGPSKNLYKFYHKFIDTLKFSLKSYQNFTEKPYIGELNDVH